MLAVVAICSGVAVVADGVGGAELLDEELELPEDTAEEPKVMAMILVRNLLIGKWILVFGF